MKKQTNTIDIVRALNEGVQSLRNSDQYRSYLSVMSHFHRYSFSNSILIYRQMPTATLVAGYHTWMSEFDRHVRKGEKGIRIYAPIRKKRTDDDEETVTRFRPVSVFDVSQTEGRPLPTIVTDTIYGTVEDYDAFICALKEISPVPVTYQALYEGHGYYSETDGRIVIARGMSQLQTVKTLIHEIAHARMHSGNVSKDRRQKEIEAESVAYTVCRHFGLNTSDYSFGYIAGWMQDISEKELCSFMNDICRTSDQMIQDIDALTLPKVSAHPKIKTAAFTAVRS